MRIFLPLGAGMWLAGLGVGLWAREWSAVAAALTGVALAVVGVKASLDYRKEFSRSAPN